MTNEEKQALIEYCERVLHGSNNGSLMERVYKIALAALTAPPVPVMQPVKQPGTKCIGWVKETIKEYDAKWRDAIRAAGYEVQEECKS